MGGPRRSVRSPWIRDVLQGGISRNVQPRPNKVGQATEDGPMPQFSRQPSPDSLVPPLAEPRRATPAMSYSGTFWSVAV
jgi:hypothetical protein